MVVSKLDFICEFSLRGFLRDGFDACRDLANDSGGVSESADPSLIAILQVLKL